MNKRRTLGYVIWLLAFLIPLQPALLSTDGVSNVTGLINFVALVILVFLGYFLVDGANAAEKAKTQHEH